MRITVIISLLLAFLSNCTSETTENNLRNVIRNAPKISELSAHQSPLAPNLETVTSYSEEDRISLIHSWTAMHEVTEQMVNNQISVDEWKAHIDEKSEASKNSPIYEDVLSVGTIIKLENHYLISEISESEKQEVRNLLDVLVQVKSPDILLMMNTLSLIESELEDKVVTQYIKTSHSNAGNWLKIQQSKANRQPKSIDDSDKIGIAIETEQLIANYITTIAEFL